MRNLLSLLFLIAGLGCFLIPLIRPNIHSCDVYIPDKPVAAIAISKSLVHYVSTEGLMDLPRLAWSVIKSEIIKSLSPLYPSDPVANKHVLMIGGSYIPQIFERARQLNIHLHVVDEDTPKNKRRSDVAYQYIPISNLGFKSVSDPDRLIQTIKIAVGYAKITGVFTLVEDHGPLTARLAQSYGTPSSSVEASLVARDKFQFRTAMKDKGLPTPRFAKVSSSTNLDDAVKSVGGYPAFLKPIYGVGSVGAGRIISSEHAVESYNKFQSQMDPSLKPIFSYGQDMIVEEIVRGSEIQLELFLFKGKVIYHSFSSQYSPNRSWLCFPVNLTDSQQKEALDLAVTTVTKAIGLTHGVVHIELFVTKSGPQVIEVNNRLSRGFLALGFPHQTMFSRRIVDYWGSVIYLSLGVIPPTRETTELFSIAVFPDTPSAEGWETEGPCALFFGDSPQAALTSGYEWVFSGRPTGTGKLTAYIAGSIFLLTALSIFIQPMVPTFLRESSVKPKVD